MTGGTRMTPVTLQTLVIISDLVSAHAAAFHVICVTCFFPHLIYMFVVTTP